MGNCYPKALAHAVLHPPAPFFNHPLMERSRNQIALLSPHVEIWRLPRHQNAVEKDLLLRATITTLEKCDRLAGERIQRGNQGGVLDVDQCRLAYDFHTFVQRDLPNLKRMQNQLPFVSRCFGFACYWLLKITNGSIEKRIFCPRVIDIASCRTALGL